MIFWYYEKITFLANSLSVSGCSFLSANLRSSFVFDIKRLFSPDVCKICSVCKWSKDSLEYKFWLLKQLVLHNTFGTMTTLFIVMYVVTHAIFSNKDNSVGYMFNVHIVSVYVPISREGCITLLCWYNTSFDFLPDFSFFCRVMPWCFLRSQQDIKILSHFLLLYSQLWRDYGQILECSTALEDPANINSMTLLSSK